MTIVKQGLQEIQRTLEDLGLRPRAALSQSEAPAEQPEDERLSLAVIEHLGPTALANGKMSVLDAFTLGWQAAKRDALTQAPQERAAVTDEWIISAVSAAKIHFVHEGAATTLAIGHAVANALLSLAQSSEGEKP
jgi:hypothetical protein